MEPFDPFSDEHRTAPYSVYARYRNAEPVHWGLSPDQTTDGTWYLFAYDDVLSAFKDHRLIHDRRRLLPPQPAPTPLPALMRYGDKFLISMDPPDHTRLRGLVMNAFTPQMVERLRPDLQQIADDLLLRTENVHVDLLKEFCAPFPLKVIAKLLGVEVVDFDQFRTWSHALAATAESRQPQVIAAAMQACEEFESYLKDVIKSRRSQPSNDLISALLEARDTSGKISEDEVVATCMLLLVAGHETTTNLIGNGMHALLSHKDQLEQLRTNPTIAANAVEELLRYDTPARIGVRWAAEDLKLRDCVIRRGQRVALVTASANRDHTVFENPDQLMLTRDMRKHLSFGFGIHFCLGAALARMEAEIALTSLLARFPELHIDDSSDPEWNETISLRGLKKLPVFLY